MSKSKSSLKDLISVAHETEQSEKTTSVATKVDTPQTNPEIESVEDQTILQEEILVQKVVTAQVDLAEKFEDYFVTNNDYGVGDLSMKIPISLHKEFKLLAAHAGVPMVKIISNILSDFQRKYKKDIAKMMKR